MVLSHVPQRALRKPRPGSQLMSPQERIADFGIMFPSMHLFIESERSCFDKFLSLWKWFTFSDFCVFFSPKVFCLTKVKPYSLSLHRSIFGQHENCRNKIQSILKKFPFHLTFLPCSLRVSAIEWWHSMAEPSQSGPQLAFTGYWALWAPWPSLQGEPFCGNFRFPAGFGWGTARTTELLRSWCYPDWRPWTWLPLSGGWEKSNCEKKNKAALWL